MDRMLRYVSCRLRSTLCRLTKLRLGGLAFSLVWLASCGGRGAGSTPPPNQAPLAIPSCSITPQDQVLNGTLSATDADNSPHLLIPQMSAQFLIAIADNDDMNDPEAKNTLRESFEAAGLEAEIEVYAGAQHGWCPPDSAVYHEEQAERAWGRLLALFERALS